MTKLDKYLAEVHHNLKSAEKLFDYDFATDVEKLLAMVELMRDALGYYSKHESVIKEAYHTGVTPEQIQVVHTFINHTANNAISAVEELASE